MKKVLGLDLGTTSVGWALVNEAENKDEKSNIVKVGVRLVHLTADEKSNFEKGKSITTNAERTRKRSMRRNLQRYKLRREALKKELVSAGLIAPDFKFSEKGKNSTYNSLELRAKAATEKISLEELAKVFLQINKKRGYKSSRKLNPSEDGQPIDGMKVAKFLYDNNITPGEYVFQRILEGKYTIPEFYKSDLKSEFDRIWECQSKFHPELTDELYSALEGKNKNQSKNICQDHFGVVGEKKTMSKNERMKENYRLRSAALTEEINLEDLTVVIQELNGLMSGMSGLLSSISDRNKELQISHLTVGQALFNIIRENPHNSLKNIVFYRQDYLDEFEQIWSVQSQFHKELTPELHKTLRDIVIFYQRPLKSKKGLVNLCEFEAKEIEYEVEGVKKTKRIGPRACPKSSPLFQEFKVWQIINNILVNGEPLLEEEKQKLAFYLTFTPEAKGSDVLKLLFKNPKALSINYEKVDGNRTMSAILDACAKIAELYGYEDAVFSKMPIEDRVPAIEDILSRNGINTDFLRFDLELPSPEFELQPAYKLWHLLYSYEGDKSVSGNQSLVEKIGTMFSMEKDAAKILASVSLQSDYGSLSTKAMRKILPYMKDGMEYSAACSMAGYRHSSQSLTKEEIENKEYVDKLEILPRNSLRNPVVEKILNQMINVVNAVIDNYGKPDEIRIELARELKKSAKERENAQAAISKANNDNAKYEEVLRKEFGIQSPSRNDIIRYKLYLELQSNGYKTLYSNTYIPKNELFSKQFEIEHIIPQARLFDDSFANKTLEASDINREKGRETAFDYVTKKYGADGAKEYEQRVKSLEGRISKTKLSRLLMKGQNIPDDFINRELRDSQYIAKKAREILNSLVKYVVPTTGSVTARLREDWQLVDVMKELNWSKYEKLGLTYYEIGRDGQRIPKIKEWTKRNDHRHHAMDAITIAFTRRQFIQYLNHLNAKINVADKTDIDLRDYSLDDIDWANANKEEKYKLIHGLQNRYLYLDHKSKYRFIPPIPLDEFRAEAKKHIEAILVSFKAKNKVCTRNVNVTKCRGGIKKTITFTPRGPLHNETIYGKSLIYKTKEETVNKNFRLEKIETVCNKGYREALRNRLIEFGGDPVKAFTGKNNLEKNPVWLDIHHSACVPSKVKTVVFDEIYTKRKKVDSTLKLDKVLDRGIRKILKARLDEFDGNAVKAFSNLEDNPIWLNKEKGIAIKSVTIDGSINPDAIRNKRDKDGMIIKNTDGKSIPSDYIAAGNNHHVAIYRDSNGKYYEVVVPFIEAVKRKREDVDVVDRNYKKGDGWEFVFTLKQNEYFVFSNKETGFNPEDYDLTDPANYSIISPNLYRVQSVSACDFKFRHHLDSIVEMSDNMKDITWKRLRTPSSLKDCVKVRVDNLGRIVAVGEYD